MSYSWTGPGMMMGTLPGVHIRQAASASTTGGSSSVAGSGCKGQQSGAADAMGVVMWVVGHNTRGHQTCMRERSRRAPSIQVEQASKRGKVG